MPYFSISVQIPDIGMHKWTNFGTTGPFLVKAENFEEAWKKLLPYLPERDPAVQEALIEQDDRKEGEYFSFQGFEFMFLENGVARFGERIPWIHG